jgi:hypothetical protein
MFQASEKVLLWRRKMNEDGGNDSFPRLQQFVSSSEVDFTHKLKPVFEEHVTQLNDWFEQ